MSPDPGGAAYPDVPGYEVLELIASTATVDVSCARDLTIGREVAIKVLRALFSESGTRRFVDGVRTMAQLQHPGIPAAHSLGLLPDGRPLLVMPLIRGLTLSLLLRDRPDLRSDLVRFLRVFEQACRIVGFAHSEGVVHRDIKPSNVMIGEHGEVQLISWNLAIVPGAITQEELQRDPSRLGAVVGTPMYMPPEQARGELADARSDVFGLGGVLCHILTGGQPFRNASVIDVVQTAAAGSSRVDLQACKLEYSIVSPK